MVSFGLVYAIVTVWTVQVSCMQHCDMHAIVTPCIYIFAMCISEHMHKLRLSAARIESTCVPAGMHRLFVLASVTHGVAFRCIPVMSWYCHGTMACVSQRHLGRPVPGLSAECACT
jgi:hypothetical protein